MTSKKPTPSEIGTRAGRIFEYKLPDNWMVRDQEDQNDHGIDAEIELKDEHGKALGKDRLFKVQIKGEHSPSYIKKKKYLSFSLSIEKLKYYFEFKIPVILVVVDTSQERVFWIPITNNIKLKDEMDRSVHDSISIHIPVKNEIIGFESESANKVLKSVYQCWEFLSVKGLQSAVENLHNLDVGSIDEKINTLGNAFFTAHHKKLEKLLTEEDYPAIYETASSLFQANSLVPAKDKFTALLYFETAFNLAPFTKIRTEQLAHRHQFNDRYIQLARESRDQALRLLSIGKYRNFQLELVMDESYALFTSNGFNKNSFEQIFFENAVTVEYVKACAILQKQIYLFNRLLFKGQYRAASDLFCGSLVNILRFMHIHKKKGAKDSIKFLESWFVDIALIVFEYCLYAKDTYRANDIFFKCCSARNDANLDINKFYEVVNKADKDLLKSFLDIEEYCKNTLERRKNFSDLSIQEQKNFFIDKAKSLRMDPDDPNCEIGRIVANALENYDPTEIIKDCENLFVHYRPGGIPAQIMQMHSMGGMHLLVCLKHHFAAGTGGSMQELYDRDSEEEFLKGFKQKHCSTCNDCVKRDENWQWSLKWQEENRRKHIETLKMFKF